MSAAAFTWLTLLVIVAIYEGWAVIFHGQTLSEYVWAVDAGHAWFRYVVLSLTGLLMWHFFGKR